MFLYGSTATQNARKEIIFAFSKTFAEWGLKGDMYNVIMIHKFNLVWPGHIAFHPMWLLNFILKRYDMMVWAKKHIIQRRDLVSTVVSKPSSNDHQIFGQQMLLLPTNTACYYNDASHRFVVGYSTTVCTCRLCTRSVCCVWNFK